MGIESIARPDHWSRAMGAVPKSDALQLESRCRAKLDVSGFFETKSVERLTQRLREHSLNTMEPTRRREIFRYGQTKMLGLGPQPVGQKVLVFQDSRICSRTVTLVRNHRSSQCFICFDVQTKKLIAQV